MGDNAHLYGFRWSVSANGAPTPYVQRMHVASAQNDTNDGAGFSVNINVGDPVKKVSTGGVMVALTTEIVYGIVVGVGQYYEASSGLMRSGPYYPNQTTWGTVEARRGYVLVAPAAQGVWEIDCDDKVTATTEATYRALIGENSEHVCPGVSAAASADPMLDISLHATTATLGWRIVDISPTKYNRDFSGSYVKVLVRVNESAEAGMPATGSIVAGV